MITSTRPQFAAKNVHQSEAFKAEPSTQRSLTQEPAMPQDGFTFSDEPYSPHPLKYVSAVAAVAFMGSLGGLAVGLCTGNGSLMAKSVMVGVSSAAVGMSISSQFV
jgi:hypothetical protein